MEDQKKQPSIVANIWRNWCNLEPQQRTQVADRLGPLGHALSIAANVTEFARQRSAAFETPASQDESSSKSEGNSVSDEDADIIDVEFEEEGI
jgi:hypothetical protein